MRIDWYAVSGWLAAFFVVGVVWFRTRPRRAPRALPDVQPEGFTHRIAVYALDGTPRPDLYLGDGDYEVKRKWDAVKAGKNFGHFELWHRTHGRRAQITRRPELKR
jgi:hypothetical protein